VYRKLGIVSVLIFFPLSHKAHKEIPIDSKRFVVLVALWETFLESNGDSIESCVAFFYAAIHV